jgi:TnpA family transposase
MRAASTPITGDDPGSKFCTHLSDRYVPFHTKVIAATASEGLYVLDQSDVTVHRHHTDGGGDSDHVFLAFLLLYNRIFLW